MAMTATPPFRRARVSIRQLYEGSSDRAHQFRYALLAFDLVTLLFIVATSFVPGNAVTETLDVVFGLGILGDFGARLLISHHRLRDLLRPTTLADIAAIVSFLAPLVGEGAGFLRILRTAWGGETQADVARTYNVDATTIGRLQPSPFDGASAAVRRFLILSAKRLLQHDLSLTDIGALRPWHGPAVLRA